MPRSAGPAFGCADFQRAARLSRRELLTVGGLTGMGLLLPDLLRAQAGAKPVLACWLWGAADPGSLAALRDAGIPTFHSPEAAVRV